MVTSIPDTLDDVAGDDTPELEKDDDNTDDILPQLQADNTAVNPLLLLLLVTSLDHILPRPLLVRRDVVNTWQFIFFPPPPAI